jgi:opacity protein-like surface antigen
MPHQKGNLMKKLLVSAAMFAAIAAPASAQNQPQNPTTSAAGSAHYIVQDTASKRCMVQNSQPTTGSGMRVIGPSFPTEAEAQKALRDTSKSNPEIASCLQ